MNTNSMQPTPTSSNFVPAEQTIAAKVFVPHSESLQQSAGILGELVPFSQNYVCLRLLDGTYSFVPQATA
ncbi:MAG: hypothetical protein RIC89_03235 [Pseudomonadales bacterium]